MFKKLFLVIALAIPMLAAAQNVKIGLVDVNEVMAAMPATAAAQKTLEEMQTKYEAQAKSLQEDLQKQAEEIQAMQNDKDALPAILERKIKAFQDSQTRYQEFLQQVGQELGKKQQELMLPITTELKNAIESVGREGNYTLVQTLEPSIVFYYGSPAENITPLVKSKLGLN